MIEAFVMNVLPYAFSDDPQIIKLTESNLSCNSRSSKSSSSSPKKRRIRKVIRQVDAASLQLESI